MCCQMSTSLLRDTMTETPDCVVLFNFVACDFSFVVYYCSIAVFLVIW